MSYPIEHDSLVEQVMHERLDKRINPSGEIYS